MNYTVDTECESLIIDLSGGNAVQYGIIEELIDNGLIQNLGGSVKIPFSVFYRWSEEDSDPYKMDNGKKNLFQLLEIEKFFNQKLHFTYSGVLGQRKWCFNLYYLNRKITRHGPFLTDIGKTHVYGYMHQHLYELLLFSEQDPAIESYDLITHHRIILAKAKKLEEEGFVIVDSLTESRTFFEIEQPLELGFNISSNTNELTLLPLLTGNDIPEDIAQDFQNQFNSTDTISQSLRFSSKYNDSKKKYVLLKKTQTEQLNKILEVNTKIRASKDVAFDVLQNPERYFDPDVIDLDNFSERVDRLDVFKVERIPNSSTTLVHWFDDCFINGIPDVKEFKIDDEIIVRIVSALEDAESKNALSFQFDSYLLKTCETRSIINAYLLKKAESADIDKKNQNETTNPVLIAKGNIQEVEYTGNSIRINTESFDPLYTELSCTLKNHQIQGISWIQGQYKAGSTGCILADDMGLGKTIQVLYFLEWVNEQRISNNLSSIQVLLVVPLTLIQNWKDEYNSFFPQGTLFFFEKPRLENISDQFEKQNKLGCVIITTYQTLQRNQIQYASIKWDIIIADEIQIAKSHTSRVSNALKVMNAPFKIAMTGTPVENSYNELWNIADWVSPGILGSLAQFSRTYSINKATSEEEIVKVGHAIRDKLGTLILRRLKSDILTSELPQKIVHNSTIDFIPELELEVPMSPYQLSKYVMIRNKAKKAVSRNEIFLYIQQLKLVSDHPRLLNEKEMFQMAVIDQIFAYESAKIPVLERLLDQVKNKNEKAIIFCEYKLTQYFISGWISKRYNIRVPVINGLSPVTDKLQTRFANSETQDFSSLSRKSVVDHFNSLPGFTVMVLSIKAAGVGLNITGANHVIHFSRHWNPAKEDQATDRAYRIGQTKDVHVYYPKLVSPDFSTFDMNIEKIIERKRLLAKEALFPSNYLDNEENISDMFLA